MLTNIKITNYLLIQELELDFAGGLTVVTGETGSGKSIIVDALMLIFGSRANGEIILKGKSQATFSASFELTNINAKQYLYENNLMNQEDHNALICRRVIDSTGKSKSYINGELVTLTQIKHLGELLIDIHAQHASIALLKPETQRKLLDEYIGVTDSVLLLSQINKNIQTLENKLKTINEEFESVAKQRDLLQNTVEELLEINILNNEWEDLNQEHLELSGADLILSELDICQKTLDGGESSLLDAVNTLKNRLTKLITYLPNITEQIDILDSVSTELVELIRNINALANKIEQNPDRLSIVSQRIEQIFNLSRKYRVSPGDLFEKTNEWIEELKVLNNSFDNQSIIEELHKETEKYYEIANVVSKKRKSGAEKLSTDVTKLLHQLALSGEFKIQISQIDNITNHGIDDIEYQVSFNRGVAVQALTKAISGGELSRTALALYVLLSIHNPPEVIIFDEIDVGIGGRVASIVGQMLQKLATNKQVICITHQPQSASFGNNHIVVSKLQKDNTTHTQANYVDNKNRVIEIARMLGGLQITETTLSHAKEMLVDAGIIL